ncbi:MAG: MBL fold metallo-hydrolase [Gemmatimonadota bacterium]|nr:MBL fold metallo-hydrolase [Gemmatimonadota bacterium]MDH3427955.1 MBL fold metallo-hydrolase [Gemmatimonadota bacterium]
MVDFSATRLAPNLTVLRADNAGPMTLDGTCSYLLGSSRVVLIDPGSGDTGHLSRIHGEIGSRQVAGILLTHAHSDHAGLAAEASRAFGAPILGSEQTLNRTGLDGIAVADGQLVAPGADISLIALATPGHSSDHMAYLTEEARWLFTGDLVLGEGSSAILYPDGNVAAYLGSLSRLYALRPSWLLPGHGPAVADPMSLLAEYRAHRLEREAQIIRALTAGARSVPEIRAAVYDPLPEGLAWAAEAAIAAHLASLLESGYDVPPFAAYGVPPEDD